MLERAAILADGGVVQADHIWLDPSATVGSAPGPALSPAPTSSPGSLDEIERVAIQQALAETGGNRRRAAERLGIGLRTLYEKLKRYGLT
jgi:two-component system response regulator FlrC